MKNRIINFQETPQEKISPKIFLSATFISVCILFNCEWKFVYKFVSVYVMDIFRKS